MNTEVENIKDIIPSINVNRKISNVNEIRKISNPVMTYHHNRYSGRGAFSPSEYNLSNVGRIEDTESYVMQSHLKKIGLMFKEGYSFEGKNLKVVEYIKNRFKQISTASGIPSELLFRQIGTSIIKKSNAFLLKVRKESASGGKRRVIPGTTKEIEPIAAYFPIPAETMRFELSGSKVTAWRQYIGDGQYKEWSESQIIHFYLNRKDGLIFGTPLLIAVEDDIRALRKIEENIEVLLYQHLFPIFHYKVSSPESPARINQQGVSEVDIARREIEYMPSEGGIVTSERYEIKSIGAESRAIRAEGYLDYFKKRVFAGLGISSVDYGEGDTANRATADNLSRNLVDSVKDIQDILEIFINEYMIKELLLEADFNNIDGDILDEENIVKIVFKEIDVDSKIKKEAHYADMFNKDVVTLNEARVSAGLDPIEIPDQSQRESKNESFDPNGWGGLRYNLFKKEEHQIEYEKIDSKERIAKVQAEKQKNNNNLKSKKRVKDSVLPNFIQLRDISNEVFDLTKDANWTSTLIDLHIQEMSENLLREQINAFNNAYIENGGTKVLKQAASARPILKDRLNFLFNRISKDIKKSVLKQENNQNSDNVLLAIFDSMEHRIKAIDSVEINKAKEWGKLQALKEKGVSELKIKCSESECLKCSNHSDKVLDLKNLTIEDLPPFHPNCNCSFDKNE